MRTELEIGKAERPETHDERGESEKTGESGRQKVNDQVGVQKFEQTSLEVERPLLILGLQAKQMRGHDSVRR